MNRRAAVLALLAIPFGARGTAPPGGVRAQEPWIPLFNGRDLTGWDSWLGKPHQLTDVPGHPRNAEGAYTQPIGLNKDPRSVFSVVRVDGEPAIRISGETYGGLITREEHENYQLRFDFKWGTRRWPPRETAVRDSGCCYHSVGPNDASYGFWMKSFEFQIQEGDCGDFYSLAGVIVDVEGVAKNPEDAKSDVLFAKGAPRLVGTRRRIVKAADYEKPRGEWNVMELYTLGGTSVHVVNGRAVMVLTNLRHLVDAREAPLTKGRIQFQSEGAEVFYRNIGIRPIEQIPSSIRQS
jgi:hypothetical protein